MANQLKFEIYGRTRIVRAGKWSNDRRSFSAYYKDYFIYVWIDEDDATYAQCTAPGGCYIVDGYAEHKRKSYLDPVRWMTVEEGIKMCLQSIFWRDGEPIAQ